MLLSTLWTYQTSIKTTTSLTPFHLIHGVEVVSPIKCEIPPLHLVIKILPNTIALEKHLVAL